MTGQAESIGEREHELGNGRGGFGFSALREEGASDSDIRYRNAMNTSGIRPTEFRVLILPKEAPKKIGSIELPASVVEKDQFAQQEGTIIECSPLAFRYETWPEGAHIPQAGDRVLFGRYAGTTTKGKDGVDYRLVSDKDISAVLE